VTDVEYAGSLAGVPTAEWDALAEAAGHVFATPEWLRTWWRHHGGGRRPLVGLVRADGGLRAIVPMYAWWRHGVAVLRFAGHGPSDRLGPICAPLADPGAADAVSAALAAVPLRRFVLLAEHVAADEGFGRLAGARPLYREPSPVLRFEHDSWAAFLAARAANFRQQVRRYPRRLAEHGALSFRLAADRDRLDRDLDILFDLHRARWGGGETPLLAAAAFHREFAWLAFDRGWLRLWFLEIDGRPAAALYGFRFAGAECGYQAGRDPALAGGQVGFVLLAHAVRAALEDGMREFRFGRGGSAYKERFATADPGIETYGLTRGAAASGVLSAALALRGRSLGVRRLLDR
jgi:CelD/BcsL family acetyltransferase involved in cellulose biosynthesis